MRRYLGIDPGVTGALAVLDLHDDGRQEIAIHHTPVTWVTVGNGKRRAYDALPMLHLLERIGEGVSLAYIEQQSARPHQGVVSMFSTGYGFGLWVGLMTALHLPHAIVHPIRWRGRVGLRPTGTSKRDKRAAKESVRLAACRRFPAVPINLECADAVMIAVAAALEDAGGGGVTNAADA